jgi:hypothetical protein
MTFVDDSEKGFPARFPHLAAIGVFVGNQAPCNTTISEAFQKKILKKLEAWEEVAKTFQGAPVPLWAPIKTADGKYGSYCRSLNAAQRKLESEAYPLSARIFLSQHYVVYDYEELNVPENRSVSWDVLSGPLRCGVTHVRFNSPFRKGFTAKLVSSTGTAQNYLNCRDGFDSRSYIFFSQSTAAFEMIPLEEAIEGVRPFVAPKRLDELLFNLHLVQRH